MSPISSTLTLLLAFLSACPSNAKIHFLTIGGGPDIFRNQIFFERNVYFFRQTLKNLNLSDQPQSLLFSCGGDVSWQPDISYLDPQEPPRVNQLLSEIFPGNGDIRVRYRPHNIPAVTGPATRKQLEDWFAKTGPTLADGDTLFIYVTTHGGGSGKPAETAKSNISLWNGQSIAVPEFTRLLDKLPQSVRVITVMVQCYSGGFGDIVYTADQSAQLSPQSRCGFFATLSTLTASGCTNSTREETYADYSTHFFAALGAEDRLGHKLDRAALDIDHDGHISLAEAHAYALLAESVDIPTTTSELYLRKVSRIDAGAAVKSSTYKSLRDAADPIRATVLDGLASQLQLATTRPSGDWITTADSMRDGTISQRQSLERKRRQFWNRYARARDKIKTDLQTRWPVLAVNWHPETQTLLRDHADEIVHAVESHSAYAEFRTALDAYNAAETDLERLETTEAKLTRFLRTAASIALEQRLGELAPEAQSTYRHLRQDEASILDAPPPISR